MVASGDVYLNFDVASVRLRDGLEAWVVGSAAGARVVELSLNRAGLQVTVS